MKKLLLYIGLLIGIVASAQVKPPQILSGPNSTGVALGNFQVDGVTLIGVRNDTAIAPPRVGSLIYVNGSGLWMAQALTGVGRWVKLGTGATASFSSLTGSYTDNASLVAGFAGKQNLLTLGTSSQIRMGDHSLQELNGAITSITDPLYATIAHDHTASSISDFTAAVRALFSQGTGISYNPATGVISATGGGGGSDSSIFATRYWANQNFQPVGSYLTITAGDARYVQLTGSYTNPSWLVSLPWTKITGTPTTLAGYGITDAASSSHTHSFASLTSKPTTLAGYGITDAQAQLSGTGFVKASGTTISYDNTTYTPTSRILTIGGIAFDISVNRTWTLTTDNITEGSNLYWTNARFDTRFGLKSTTDLAEGSNLYFTNARAIAAPLTGYAVGTNTALSTSDNILTAFGKLQAQINAAGSGSGNVNTGNANRLAYYSSTGTTVTELSAITASRVLVSDVNGLPLASSVTTAELGYLSGVTSSIQTQFAGKVTANAAITPGTGTKITYDAKGLIISSASATTSDISEGSNLYFTEVRVRSTLLTGLSTAVNAPIAATDNIIVGMGKLQAQISGFTGVPDGDKGEISINSGVWTLDNGVVTNIKVGTGIDAAKLADGSVSNSEFQYLANVTSDVQTQLNNRVIANSAITPGTATKVTYDAKGLILSATNATTSDIAEGSNLYFTETRVKTTVLSGISTASAIAVNSTDNVLSGLGKLQAQINSINGAGYLTGNQTITLSGDISGSGATAITTTIGANAVTLGKMAQVATATFLGRATSGTGNVEALTVTQATAMLNTFTSTLKGLAPASSGGTTNFLRADGTWAAPPVGTGTVMSVSIVTANGFAGSVATSTTNPAITISTTISGILKGNGTAISAAVSGTDYLAPSAITADTSSTSSTAIPSMATLKLLLRGFYNDISGAIDSSYVDLLKYGGDKHRISFYGATSGGSGGSGDMTYPGAGIAVSTGSAWGTSITDNSINWNTAYSKRITSAGFSGTTTKTLTLTYGDGSTITASFTDNEGSGGTTYTAGTGISISGGNVISNTITNTNQLTNGAGFITASDLAMTVASVAATGNYTATGVGIFKLPDLTGQASRTFALPSASTYTGRTIVLINRNANGSNLWTIQPTTVRKPDGTYISAIANGSSMTLISDGADWFIQSTYQ